MKEFPINNNFADCSMYRDLLVGHSLGLIKCFINGIAPSSAHGFHRVLPFINFLSPTRGNTRRLVGNVALLVSLTSRRKTANVFFKRDSSHFQQSLSGNH